MSIEVNQFRGAREPRVVIPERIVCAAAMDPMTQEVYLSVRHGDELFWKVFGDKWSAVHLVQGFITNRKRFVGRREAFIIASEQNQIIRKSGNPNSKELFSEDLY